MIAMVRRSFFHISCYHSMQLLVRPLPLVEHAPTAPDMLSISIACVGIPGAVLHHRVACLALSGILTLIYYHTYYF